MKLHAISYYRKPADFHTRMDHTRQQFDSWTVIGSSQGEDCATLCESHGLQFYRWEGNSLDGQSVAKIVAAAQHESSCGNGTTWVLFIDIDVILPRSFRTRLEGLSLDRGSFYSVERMVACSDGEMFLSVLDAEPWEHLHISQQAASRLFLLGTAAQFESAASPDQKSSQGLSDSPGAAHPWHSQSKTLPFSILHLTQPFPGQALVKSGPIPESLVRSQYPPKEAREVVIVGYYPGSSVINYFEDAKRVYLVDRFGPHWNGTTESLQEDQITLRSLLKEILSERETCRFLESEVAQDFVNIPDQSIDVLHFCGEIEPGWFIRTFNQWKRKLQTNATISGDLFGYPLWEEHTVTLSSLLGPPDVVLPFGFWIRSYEAVRAMPWSTTSAQKGGQVVLVVANKRDDLSSAFITLQALRQTWEGTIELLYRDEPSCKAVVVCELLHVRLQTCDSTVLRSASEREVVTHLMSRGVVPPALILFAGCIPLTNVGELLSYGAQLKYPRVAGIRMDLPFECDAPLREVSACDYVEGTKGHDILVCRGNPVYWTDSAWEVWSLYEANLTLSLAPSINVSDNVSVIIEVHANDIPDFQQSSLTWRFPSTVPTIVIFIGVEHTEIWLPGLSENARVLCVQEDVGRGQLLESVLEASNTAWLCFLTPQCIAKPGATLIFHQAGEPGVQVIADKDYLGHATARSSADPALSGDSFFGMVRREVLERLIDKSIHAKVEIPFGQCLQQEVAQSPLAWVLFDPTRQGWLLEPPTDLRDSQSQWEGQDLSLAICINVFEESRQQLHECFSRIAANLPEAVVGVFLDGVERPDIKRLAEGFGYAIFDGEQLGNNATWHRWWMRMLEFFKHSGAGICFKFDPDTMVDRRPVSIPRSDYFGTVERDYIQGGITGLSRTAVLGIMDSGLLEPCEEEPRPWLHLDANDSFMDDQAIAKVLGRIGILPSRWSECISRWKTPVKNNPVEAAIVHPRFYPPSGERQTKTKDHKPPATSPALKREPEKILVYASDENFFEYTKASFASFTKHHDMQEWRVLFLDVGLSDEQRNSLRRFGEVIRYARCSKEQQHGLIYPAARAKMELLIDHINDEAVLLHIDSDTLIYDNLDELVREFHSSSLSIAMTAEDVPDFWRSPISSGWRDRRIPSVFKRQKLWSGLPILNAGVFLAKGPQGRALGRLGLRLYELLKDDLLQAEQAVMGSIIYDWGIPVFPLPIRYNCFVWESALEETANGQAERVPTYRGERVAVRHFAGPSAKEALDRALNTLGYEDVLQKVARPLAH